jgi:light-regulated signal transduction histidine kinase (bacteriophytochrome)
MADARRGRAEEEAERLRQQLGRVNAEFEEFISMAAHGLRQSLRDVASFSQLMSETYASRLDSDAGMFLARIQEGAARMQSLLADVVDYWEAGSGEPSRTDMEAVLRQAVLDTDVQVMGKHVDITHDPLPAVRGDSEMLVKVFHQLIKNAIEYCEAPSPRVHISSRRLDSDWVFSVEDNGPGIEPAFQGRIFQPFKPLHGKEHPGNGLGLAFCKKAIEWHGGRIWVESQPGAGSTFSFTLPAAEY